MYGEREREREREARIHSSYAMSFSLHNNRVSNMADESYMIDFYSDKAYVYQHSLCIRL